jgi:hypothetical protein
MVNIIAAKITAKVVPRSKELSGAVVAIVRRPQAKVATTLPNTPDRTIDTSGRHIVSLSD